MNLLITLAFAARVDHIGSKEKMTDKKLICLGYGYTAAALARRLRDDGWDIAGTTTSQAKAAEMEESGVTAHLWKSDNFDPAWLDGATAILISTPPGTKGCPAFHAASDAITARHAAIKWIGYLSTNGRLRRS